MVWFESKVTQREQLDVYSREFVERSLKRWIGRTWRSTLSKTLSSRYQAITLKSLSVPGLKPHEVRPGLDRELP
jgi:hypothetical protein